MTTKEIEAQNRKNDLFRDTFGVSTTTAHTIPTILVFANKTDAADFQAWAKSVHYTALNDDKLPRNKARVGYTVNHLLNKAIDEKHSLDYAVPWSKIRELADTWRSEVADRETRLDADILLWEGVLTQATKARDMAVKFRKFAPEEITEEEVGEAENAVQDAQENLNILYRMANTRETKRCEKAKITPIVLPYPNVAEEVIENTPTDDTSDLGV